MIRAIVACLLVCAMSCGLMAQSTPSQVILWLFRPNSDNLSSVASLYVDGRKLVNLAHGQFFGIHVSPGMHAFNWTNQLGARQVVVPVGADPEAYLEVTFISNSPFLSINPLSADKAIAAMSGVRPIDQNGVFDSGVIVPAHAMASVETSSAELATNAKPAPVSVSARNGEPNPRSKAEKETIWVTAVPQESNVVTSTSTYQTLRTAKTPCGGTAIAAGPLTNGNVNCDATYNSPPQHKINFRLDVMNKVRAEDGQVYTITCSAHWLASNCASLIDGDRFKAEVEKTTMWITAYKSQNKQVRIKYKILDIR